MSSLLHPIDRGKTAPSENPPRPARKPFAQIEHDLASDPRLSPVDVRVVLALVYFARTAHSCWPSDRSIGERVGRSIATIQRSLRKLAQLGMIERLVTGDNITGRLIVLIWRQRATPVSSVSDPRTSSMSDEGIREEKKERPCGGSGKDSPPPPGGTPEGEPAPSAEDIARFRAWASGPNAAMRRFGRAALRTIGVVDDPAPATQEQHENSTDGGGSVQEQRPNNVTPPARALSPMGDKPALMGPATPFRCPPSARPAPARPKSAPPSCRGRTPRHVLERLLEDDQHIGRRIVASASPA